MANPLLGPADIGPVAAAIRLAARGFAVFPLLPGTKIPAVRHDWEGAASADPVRIVDAWPDRRCNVAIACGPSRLLVIDLDVAKSPADDFRHGVDSLRRTAGARDLPETLTVATPSGGRHLYYRAPPATRLRNSVARLGPLIDTRGVGGYVVGPGSIINGRRYRIVREAPIAMLPSWLVELLEDQWDAPRSPVGTTIPAATSPRAAASPAYAAAVLRNEVDRVLRAVPGTRNDTLNKAAFALGRLVGAGMLDRRQAVEELRDAGERTGLPRREVRSTVESGLSAGTARPRVVSR
jgi:hypothetical protein